MRSRWLAAPLHFPKEWFDFFKTWLRVLRTGHAFRAALSKFRERPPPSRRFFWQGRSGLWRDSLSEEQVARHLCCAVSGLL